MYFSLDVRRARKGDCLLLHFGPKDDPGLVMVDGGPSDVYVPHLRPRLEQIRKARKGPPQNPLVVDLLMVSHVDDDHIKGILDLTKEMVDAQQAKRPQALQVLAFWHNSFDSIIGNTPEELTAAFKETSFGAAATTGTLPEDARLDAARFEERAEREVMVDTLKVLASIEQGHRLRSDAQRLSFPLNPHFGEKLILASKGGAAIDIGRELTVTVLGPMKPELDKLHTMHDEWLAAQKGKKKKSATAALAAYVDRSVPNLSSIAVLAVAGKKRILLTGDARGDKILAGLEFVGVLKKDGRIHVEVLKVPHHGSANNLDVAFFERITADHYVFSGNGEHGNPERESLQMLLDARDDADYTIHLTYPVDEIDAERKNDWIKEQAKEKARKAKKVRPNWSPAKHSLAAFLAAHKKLNDKIKIVPKDGRHLIDLHEAVPY